MSNKKIFIATVSALIMVGFSYILVGAQGTYEPMEPIPGGAEQSTFPEYVAAIYKFALWTVGISAMFMISIGGFMYFTAAGNTSKTEKAKSIITDAIWGLIAVMVAWTVLNVINPDLVNIDLSKSLEGASSSATSK